MKANILTLPKTTICLFQPSNKIDIADKENGYFQIYIFISEEREGIYGMYKIFLPVLPQNSSWPITKLFSEQNEVQLTHRNLWVYSSYQNGNQTVSSK